jgi:organic radical activating enzyme
MNDPIQTFTSTGRKLLHEWRFIKAAVEHKQIYPLSIECAPEARCNLNCSYCSNANRTIAESLDPYLLLDVFAAMKRLGAKSIQWTGGGEVLLYPDINMMIKECAKMGYQQGMITNGTMFHKLAKHNLKYLKWIRVSLNEEAFDKIKIPDLPDNVTLGLSHVYTDDTTPEVIHRINEFIKRCDPKYVRIVSNCLTTPENQERNNRIIASIVKSWGPPYFYQPKEFKQPERCWWFMVKPFILHDGFVYRCSSVVLNPNSEGRFHERYRFCRLEELVDFYQKKSEPYIPDSCSNCVFYPNNMEVDSLMNPTGMEAFK